MEKGESGGRFDRMMSRVAASANPLVGMARTGILPWMLKLPPLQDMLLKRLTGLD